MRHGKKINHLGRTSAHRNAMLSNMASSLIEHKRINTTVAKAKALRVYVEPILTKSKEDSTHNRRVAFSYLQSKEAVTELFRTVGPKISDRNGGYCRIIKTGFRAGDAADMAMIELVDFNEIYNPNEEEKKTTRRSRRGTAKKAEGVATLLTAAKADKQEGASEDKPAEKPVELDQEEEKVADAEVSTEAPAQETDTESTEEKAGE